jgi:pimeloyl-ACP methyl ester carboxylesterase
LPRIQRNRASIYYQVHGEGPTIVFAHGAEGNLLSWFQQIPVFATRHRVIAYDHRGFGRSECDFDDFRTRDHPGDLMAVLDAEGVQRAALVGHMMGGWTSLRTALEHPERVSCLVLCASSGGLMTPRLARELTGGMSAVAQGAPWQRDWLAPGFAKRKPALAFLHDCIFELNPPTDATVIAQLFETDVKPEELAGYSVPTLFVNGRRGVYPTELTFQSAARVPGAKTHVFEDSGNSPFFETPAEFNRVVGEFVSRRAEW